MMIKYEHKLFPNQTSVICDITLRFPSNSMFPITMTTAIQEAIIIIAGVLVNLMEVICNCSS